jgi:hypothetical protein
MRPRTKVIGKKANAGLTLAEVTFKGFDHDGRYNPGEHTATDREKHVQALAMLKA